jgi:phosphoglycerate dehydrogenase-like enzyme
MTEATRVASLVGDAANAEVERMTGAAIAATTPDLANAVHEATVLWAYPVPSIRKGAPKPAGWPGKLKWVEVISAGIDVYAPWLFEGVTVTCGRGTLSDPIEEYVIAAIFARAKRWDQARARGLADWGGMQVERVAGTTLGLIGLGSIGAAVARRAIGLDMTVIGYSRTGRNVPPGVTAYTELSDVLGRADHLVLAVPLTPQTRNLMNARTFAQMKPGAHLINVARGEVIDQDALAAAVDAGQVGYASLDVTAPEPLPDGHPLYARDNIRISPHMSGRVEASNTRFAPHFIDNMARFQKGEPLADVADPARGY